jgi:signal peptidase II
LKKIYFIALVAVSVVTVDYISKQIILRTVPLFEGVSVLPFLRIVNIWNEGAAFGLFANLGNRFFMFLSFAAIICILIYTMRVRSRLELFSLSVIIGGAIGNLLDRIIHGKVIDFIDFYIGKWHWPAFNVADSALTVGVILFILSSLKHGQSTRKEREKAA